MLPFRFLDTVYPFWKLNHQHNGIFWNPNSKKWANFIQFFVRLFWWNVRAIHPTRHHCTVWEEKGMKEILCSASQERKKHCDAHTHGSGWIIWSFMYVMRFGAWTDIKEQLKWMDAFWRQELWGQTQLHRILIYSSCEANTISYFCEKEKCSS